MNILVLEDDPERVKIFQQKLGRQFTWAADAQEGIEALQKHHFDVVFLDHDLGGEVFVSTTHENTGSQVVRWMVSNTVAVGQPCIIIHSLNHPAATSMMLSLVEAGFEYVTTVPFTQLKNELDNPDFLS